MCTSHSHTRAHNTHGAGSGPVRVLSRAGGPSACLVVRRRAICESPRAQIGVAHYACAIRAVGLRAAPSPLRPCACGRRPVCLQASLQCAARGTATLSSVPSLPQAARHYRWWRRPSSLVFYAEHLFLFSLHRILPLGANLTFLKLYKLLFPFPSSPHFHFSIFQDLERERDNSLV